MEITLANILIVGDAKFLMADTRLLEPLAIFDYLISNLT